MPSQTTIHPDDVEAIVRDLDKKPEPNPYMVEAHRKEREMFQPPMSKPSEKAMQVAYNAVKAGYMCGVVARKITDARDEQAELIERHTAEAVAEYKRVLDEAEEALSEISRRVPNYGHEGAGTVARQSLAAIAKLQTNEKL